jgi:hypothetical protein
MIDGVWIQQLLAAFSSHRAARKWHKDPVLNFLEDGSLNPERKKSKKR